MKDYYDVIRKSVLLKVINKALDYSEMLAKLAGECIDNKDSSEAKQFWYAGSVFKTFAEELLDEEEKKW